MDGKGNILESVAWGCAIIAFLTIAYKAYTGDDKIPTREEMLAAFERGAEKAVLASAPTAPTEASQN